MKPIRFDTEVRKILADTVTPVSIYLRVRDLFPDSVLLESADFLPNEKSFSFIGVCPIVSFEVDSKEIRFELHGERPERKSVGSRGEVRSALREFVDAFQVEPTTVDGKTLFNGLFGFTAYDAVEFFEELELQSPPSSMSHPTICYRAFRFVIAIDHSRNELFVIENRLHSAEKGGLTLDEFLELIARKDFTEYRFQGLEASAPSLSQHEYCEVVRKCQAHVQRGDVFQVVPSRRFERRFRGDDFNVYRALRSINPSPYLFYFDYGSFRLFGSSPEAQLVIRENRAMLFPIAGTYRRTGNDAHDRVAIEELKADPKENSEHVMLVDLARNDLSRHCQQVTVEEYKSVQLFSHVIHLTSRVAGELLPNAHPLDVFMDTFPMGTLSGAPKYRAIEIIDSYEPVRRGLYGGAVGTFGFDGSVNHAIVIRSFVSAANILSYQAGAGVVSGSVPEQEAQEVVNKLSALEKAVVLAEKIV